jgi:hypothetical protein
MQPAGGAAQAGDRGDRADVVHPLVLRHRRGPRGRNALIAGQRRRKGIQGHGRQLTGNMPRTHREPARARPGPRGESGLWSGHSQARQAAPGECLPPELAGIYCIHLDSTVVSRGHHRIEPGRQTPVYCRGFHGRRPTVVALAAGGAVRIGADADAVRGAPGVGGQPGGGGERHRVRAPCHPERHARTVPGRRGPRDHLERHTARRAQALDGRGQRIHCREMPCNETRQGLRPDVISVVDHLSAPTRLTESTC